MRPKHLLSIKNRLSLVSAHFAVTKDCPPALDSLIDEFCKLVELRASDISQSGATLLCYLVFLGRYPLKHEEDRFISDILASGMRDAIVGFMDTQGFRSSFPSTGMNRLVIPDSDSLCVDVTHTSNYPYNSGIQRVVRKLARELESQGKKTTLFRVDYGLNIFMPLTPEEKVTVLDFNHKIPTSNLRLLLTIFPRIIRMITSAIVEDTASIILANYHRLRNQILTPLARRSTAAQSFFDWIDRNKLQVRSTLQSLRHLLSRLSFRKAIPQTCFVFLGNRILLPEMTVQSVRIDLLTSTRKAFGGRITLFVYDMIPLIAPEYCVLNVGFIDYLRIFRVADQICCDSFSVQKDVENILNVITRQIPEPAQVSYQYLGADFHGSDTELSPELKEFIGDHPLILSVGTVEPRKNQIALVRAAHALHKKGLKFKVCFVGNPGWKNEEFLRELNRSDPSSEFMKIIYRATDEVLNSLYKRASFSFFCSHAEGFGLPIIESLYHKKPVLTSNIGSMKELAEICGGCMMASPSDVEEIAGAIESLLLSPQKLRQLEASIKLPSNMSWASFAQRLWETAISN